MSTSMSDIVEQIRAALAISDPDLDTSVGTTTRKIVDAVSEQIAEAYLDQHMMTYVYDIDSKSGADLDTFCQTIGGIARLGAKRASGTVTFIRSGPTTDMVPIGANTQVTTTTSPQVTAATIVSSAMLPGESTVTVPVQAVDAGPAGNTAAGTLTAFASTVDGISTCINTDALTGGTDQETDAELRARWKQTAFRSMAGTECQPPGTMVLVPKSSRHVDGKRGGTKIAFESVPIESIEVGDRVCSWRQGYVIKEGREVTGITSRDYSGRMVVVRTSDGRESRYTPNHRCMVRMGPALDGKSIVYLQRRGTSFRIGTTAGGTIGTSKQTGTRGVVSRMMSQGADEAWVLSVHDSKDEALLEEALTSWRFGIPMTLFIGNNSRGDQSQGRLDQFWEKVGDLTEAAIRCLDHFGRILDFPLVRSTDFSTNRRMWNRAGVVQACNLIDGAEVIDVDAMRATGENFPRVQYASLRVRHEWYDGPVWSMDVDREHTYVADGFVTHNSMYLGQALDNPTVTAARVIGSSVTQIEQVQPSIPTSGPYAGKLIAQSVLPDIAHVYQQGVMVGGDVSNGILLTPGLDYTIDPSSNPPVIVFTNINGTYDTGSADLNGAEITAPLNGGILDFQYRYLPTVSRNDPDGTRFGSSSHVNRVDLIVAGNNPEFAMQSTSFQNSAVFSGVATDPVYTGDFVHPDGSHPTAGNIFIPLAFGPILQLPDSIQIGASSYGMVGSSPSGVTVPDAYQMVHDVSPFGMTADSRFGLEFNAANLPANNTVFTVGLNSSYIYNSTPGDVQAAVERWRLLGTDVQTHGAQQIFLRVSVIVMYDRGVDRPTVNTAIDQAFSALLASGGMGGVLQVSDIEQAIHNVAGVDNVRLAMLSDYPSGSVANNVDVGVQQIVGGVVVKSYLSTSGRPTDIRFPDNAAPVMDSVVKLVRAQNTFTA